MIKTVIKHINDYYAVSPEYLFESSPDTAVFRNSSTNKWFAVIMRGIKKTKLGVNSEDLVDIINLKCDPVFSYAVVDGARVFRGYHMNKQHWISVVLDKNTDKAMLFDLIEQSYDLIDKRRKNDK